MVCADRTLSGERSTFLGLQLLKVLVSQQVNENGLCLTLKSREQHFDKDTELLVAASLVSDVLNVLLLVITPPEAASQLFLNFNAKLLVLVKGGDINHLHGDDKLNLKHLLVSEG